MTRKIGEILSKTLKDLGIPATPDVIHPSKRLPGLNRNRIIQKTSKYSLPFENFIAIPRGLDDFVVSIGEHQEMRGMAKTLQLVVIDLMRYTDLKNRDVIVSNMGIAGRRHLSSSSVKAAMSLLLKMKILRRDAPNPARYSELNRQLKKGFSSNRRYLVWNSQDQWEFPSTKADFEAITDLWLRYGGRKRGSTDHEA